MSLPNRPVRRTVQVLIPLFVLLIFAFASHAQTSAGRNAAIPYDNQWYGPPNYRWIAYDALHQQIFTAWTGLDRIDVLSATDYHLIHSIPVASPSSVDISPDGSTLAVANSSAHILFFNTATFGQTSDLIFPDSFVGVSAFVYTANGNAIIRAETGTTDGVTAFWTAAQNSFTYQPPNPTSFEPALGYQTNGPLSRSGDYSRVILGDATTLGAVQIIDGATGNLLEQTTLGGYILGVAANNDGSRFAVCVEPAGLSSSLAIYDSSLNLLYQDQSGCGSMAFSTDGTTLYRDVTSTDGNTVTQAMNVSSFTAHNTTDYYSTSGYNDWGTADGTGMVYGILPGPTHTSTGMVFAAVDTTTSATPQLPASDPLALLHVIDTIGSASGGDPIRLLCSGVDTTPASSISVTIGGASASVLSVAPPSNQNLPSVSIVTVKTPAGSPGLADVVLSANGTTSTAAKAFQYASTKLFPFSTTPTYLLYDNSRQKLYASHGDQVEVIDPVSGQLLTPLVPASGQNSNSQFAGLSLSPDSNRLYIADPGTHLIYMLDLTQPGTGITIDPTAALGAPSPIAPARAWETASGSLVGSDGSGSFFTLDPGFTSGSWITDTLGIRISASPWDSVEQGAFIFSLNPLSPLGNFGQVGLWDAVHSVYTPSADATPLGLTYEGVEASANQDATVIAVGGSTPGRDFNSPNLLGFDLNPIGYLLDHFDVSVPAGTPSFFFDPTGALLFKAGTLPNSNGGYVEIDDLHQWQPAGTVVLPEPFVTSYTPYSQRMLAIDNTGQYLFGVTQPGIILMQLSVPLLSVGNVQPSFGVAAGGQSVTIRGSGFLSGATVSFNGVPALNTNFVDAETLTAVTPAITTPYADVTVTNPNGSTYTAPNLFRIPAPHPSPVISGFSPSALTVQSDLQGADTSATVTILGSGFDVSDSVTIQGQPIVASFVDSGHLLATIPAQVTGTTGSLPLTVTAPDGDGSSTLSLQLVNPVPIIDSMIPVDAAVQAGGSILLYGRQFVAGSTIEWNGQPLTKVNFTQSIDGEQSLQATFPASLPTAPGNSAITVVNPPPGGGTSNSVTMAVGDIEPVVNYPGTIDFGNVLLNTTSTQNLYLANIGLTAYGITSATVTGTGFSLLPWACMSVATPGQCWLQLQFQPTATGTASGTLTLVDNVAGSPHVISLTGTGIQNLTPVVNINFITVLGNTVSATLNATATVGGPTVPATAWIEYGTDPTMTTFTDSPTWTFTGDQVITSSLTGLNPSTQYYARVAVQTSGGIGRSSTRIFATAPAWPNVLLGLAAGVNDAQTVTAGKSASWSLLANDGGNGWTGSATLSCSGAPTGATCTVSPSTLAIGVNPASFTVTVTTTAPSTSALAHPVNAKSLWVLSLAIGIWIFPGRRSGRRLSLLLCLAFLSTTLVACGGGGSTSSAGGTSPPVTATPAGTYYIQVGVSANGSSLPGSGYQLQLNVQ